MTKEDIKHILEYAASNKRTNADFFTVANMFEKVSTNLLSKFKDDDRNIYERYVPKIVETVNSMLKGKLKKTDYGTFNSTKFEDSKRATKRKVLVFIIGGVTYQEDRELQASAKNNNFEVIVGSNLVINSEK